MTALRDLVLGSALAVAIVGMNVAFGVVVGALAATAVRPL
jgi:hypothetical protein